MQYLVKETRKKAGREEGPSYGLIDLQSVKTVYTSDERGIDGGNKRKDGNGT
jgi:putative transposase